MKKRKFLLLSLMLLWPAHLLVYFLTCFRSGYLLLPYFVFFAIAAAGLTASFSNVASRKERWFWITMLAALMVRAIVIHKPDRLMVAASFFVGSFLIVKVMEGMKNHGREKTIGLLLALSIAMAGQNAYPVAKFRTLGRTADERALLYMTENLAPGARVATYTPGMAMAANMTHVTVNLVLRNVIRSDQDLIEWMKREQLKAIYMDGVLRICEPYLWSLIKGQIGRSLKIGFSDETGQTQVLLVSAGAAGV